ncbi:MAG: hypothetical protein AAF975_08930, partial [Spirochaetota bacterium]
AETQVAAQADDKKPPLLDEPYHVEQPLESDSPRAASTLSSGKQNVADQALDILKEQAVPSIPESFDERISSEISQLLTELSSRENLPFVASQQSEEEYPSIPKWTTRLELPDDPFELPDVDTSMYRSDPEEFASANRADRSASQPKSYRPESVTNSFHINDLDMMDMASDSPATPDFLSSNFDFPEPYYADPLSSWNSSIIEIPDNPLVMESTASEPEKMPMSRQSGSSVMMDQNIFDMLDENSRNPEYMDQYIEEPDEPERVPDINELMADLLPDNDNDNGLSSAPHAISILAGDTESDVPSVDQIEADAGIPALNLLLSSLDNNVLLEENEELHLLLENEK